MSTASQFLGGGDPVGSLTLGIGLPPDKYIPCDGGTVTRAAWPRLSPLFPLGRYIRTTRTLLEVPNQASLAVSPTYFVTVGSNSAGTNKIQYSTDGATWTNASVSHPSCVPFAVIWAGNRFVAISNDNTNAFVTSGDNPGSTWTSTTNVPQNFSNPRLAAYSPELNRALVLQANTGTGYYLGSGTAWTAGSAPPATPVGLAWTGSVFLAAPSAANPLMHSTDGSSAWTYNTSLYVEAGATIASNGSGTVVVAASGFIYVSSDHGTSWRTANIAGKRLDGLVSYSGGLFFITLNSAPNAGHIYASPDGINWFVVNRELINYGGVAAKKGATTVVLTATASAFSYTESATDFLLPSLPAFSLSAATSGTFATSLGNYYIKAA